jgi:hypothetical protein
MMARMLWLLALTLPVAARIRYYEEWSADAAGARELGLKPIGVLGGAVAVAATIDRTDPAVSGMPVSVLAGRRARWGLALIGVGALLAGSVWITAGPQWLLIPGSLLVVIGLLQSIRGVMSLSGLPRPIALLVGLLTIPVAVIGGVALLAGIVPLMMALGGVGAVGAMLLPVVGPSPTGRRHAVAAGGASAVAVLAVVAVGILHITVWNPLAKLPGLTLDDIYGAMAAAGEAASPVLLVIWASGGVLSAVALLVLGFAPTARIRLAASTRRIVIVGLAAVAGSALSVWVAGFGVGMGIADTFGTDGGDRAGTGVALTLIGAAAGIPAVLLALVPGPWRGGSETFRTRP